MRSLLALGLPSVALSSIAEPTRVACVGDSSTVGAGIGGRETDSYAAPLQQRLVLVRSVADVVAGEVA